MSGTGPALERVRANLAPHPLLAGVFERLFATLTARDDVALLASGSLAAGAMDHLSDLDLELVVPSDADLADAKAFIQATLATIETPLCRFVADHLGLRDLIVSFHEAGGTVVKIDVWVMTPAALPAIPKAVVIHDPRGLASHRPAPWDLPPADFDDLACKFCGWMWFTHIKIVRGHFLEAMESIEIMRSYALLPSLHASEELPREGYRLLEERLSPERLEVLYRTYPTALDRERLYNAMDELAGLFASLQGEGRGTCVERMRGLIEADRARPL